jgi:hypothetical protein
MRRAALLAASFVVATACLGAQASKPAPTATAQAAVAFDSAKAWEHLRQMVNIGPRPAGSPQLRQTRAYITRHMAALGLKVEEQPFTADTPVGKVDMVNLIVRLPGRRPERILFTGHYDTKPMKNVVFVGASDGASSAAMLMELVRVFKERPREYTYEFVWLDGEEAFCMGWDDCGKPGSPDNTYGSRYYVQAAKKANATASIKANILVDMVADKDLRIQRESKSTGCGSTISSGRRPSAWATARSSPHLHRDRRRSRAVSRGRHPLDRHHRSGLPAVAHRRRHARSCVGEKSADRRRRDRRGDSRRRKETTEVADESRFR